MSINTLIAGASNAELGPSVTAKLLAGEPYPSTEEAGTVKHADAGFRGYPRRFGVLLTFALSTCMNACLWICFSPIVDATSARLDTDNNGVNMFSTVFMILYLPGSIMAVYVLERYGLRATLIVGAVLNAACAWVRFAGTHAPSGTTQYTLVMLGQVLGGLAQPIFTNTPSRIAGDWFPSHERDLATVVAAMTNPLGNGLGTFIPTLVVNGPDDLPALMLYLAIPTAVILILTVVLVADRPPTPPSAAAAARHEMRSGAGGGEEKDGHASDAMSALRQMRSDFGALFLNFNFLLLLVAFSIGVGVFNSLLTVLYQWINVCGYTQDDAGNGGVALLGAGLLMAIVAGVLLEKTKAYVRILQGGIVLTVVSLVFLLLVQRPGNSGLLYGALAAVGGSLLPLLPISLENAAECSFPIPEDNSAALLLIMGQFVGIGATSGMTALINISNCSTVLTPVAAFLFFALLLAAVVLLFFRKDYRRQAAEAQRKAAAALPADP